MFSMTEGATKLPHADNLCSTHALFYGIEPQVDVEGMQDCAGAWTQPFSLGSHLANPLAHPPAFLLWTNHE